MVAKLIFYNCRCCKNCNGKWVKDIVYIITVTECDKWPVKDFVKEKVAQRVKTIFILNAFSPNNDGINYQWIIKQLAEYSEATVNVLLV